MEKIFFYRSAVFGENAGDNDFFVPKENRFNTCK